MPSELDRIKNTNEKKGGFVKEMELFDQKKAGRTGWWEGEVGEMRIKVLESCFRYDASDAEACFNAGIQRDSLYRYMRTNPEFAYKKKMLKHSALFSMRKLVIEEGLKNPEFAFKYLEKKLPEEFGKTPAVGPSNIVNFNNIRTIETEKEYEELLPGDTFDGIPEEIEIEMTNDEDEG